MSHDVQERFIDFLNEKEFTFVDYNASIINDILDDSRKSILMMNWESYRSVAMNLLYSGYKAHYAKQKCKKHDW